MSAIKFEEFEASICSHYVTALEYGDNSALDDNDIKLVNDYLEQWGSVIFEYSEETSFQRDDISGLMADCYDVKIFKQLK